MTRRTGSRRWKFEIFQTKSTREEGVADARKRTCRFQAVGQREGRRRERRKTKRMTRKKMKAKRRESRITLTMRKKRKWRQS